MEKPHYLSCLVDNRSGVLTRISGLFARRGYNIESLSVCATENDSLSRMTIAVRGNEKVIEQIVKQLNKQVDVLNVVELDYENAVIRELLQVKIEIHPEKRSEILDICTIFKAHIIDLSDESLILELTGKPQKIDAFISVLRPYSILELARSGASALLRGKIKTEEV